MKNIVLITGTAGSGLSSAEYVFEELGYFVVKNVPPVAINSVIDEFLKNKKYKNVAIVAHAINAKESIDAIRERTDANYRFIVLSCEKEELLKRYALTRRVHPRVVTQKVSATKAIELDISEIQSVEKYANLFIDTTSLTVKQLRTRLYKFLENIEEERITSVNFMSFGLKNGIPQGIDTFFDVRIIPNPYWVEALKELTGEDQEVIDYLNSFPITQQVIDNIVSYLNNYLKELLKMGRGSYTIGIACSGGQHRSTYVANYLAEYFSKEYRTQVFHRDCPQLNKE